MLAPVGLVVVVVLGLCLFVYRVFKCDCDRLFVCLCSVLDVVSIWAITALTDMVISEKSLK